MCYQRQLCFHWWFFSLIITIFADRINLQYPSPSYLRKMSNRNGLARERDGTDRIRKIYHYDNLTDCENACEMPCSTTYVILNDVDERRQFICMQRKAPAISAFININDTGIIPIVLASLLILSVLLLILCCCCLRCGCACCRKMCYSRNASNDPLVNGEFRETLDSKDIGYLKKEVDRKIITV